MSKVCEFKLTVYGFVPIINDSFNTLFDLTDDYTIGYGNIRLKKYQAASSSGKHMSVSDVFLPIADTIEKSTPTVPLSFYMKIFSPNVDLRLLSKCQHALKFNGTCPLELPENEHFKIENETIVYLSSSNDITFYRNNVLAIAEKFFCVCTYINPVTGDLSKTLLPPEDLYPVL